MALTITDQGPDSLLTTQNSQLNNIGVSSSRTEYRPNSLINLSSSQLNYSLNHLTGGKNYINLQVSLSLPNNNTQVTFTDEVSGTTYGPFSQANPVWALPLDSISSESPTALRFSYKVTGKTGSLYAAEKAPVSGILRVNLSGVGRHEADTIINVNQNAGRTEILPISPFGDGGLIAVTPYNSSGVALTPFTGLTSGSVFTTALLDTKTYYQKFVITDNNGSVNYVPEYVGGANNRWGRSDIPYNLESLQVLSISGTTLSCRAVLPPVVDNLFTTVPDLSFGVYYKTDLESWVATNGNLLPQAATLPTLGSYAVSGSYGGNQTIDFTVVLNNYPNLPGAVNDIILAGNSKNQDNLQGYLAVSSVYRLADGALNSLTDTTHSVYINNLYQGTRSMVIRYRPTAQADGGIYGKVFLKSQLLSAFGKTDLSQFSSTDFYNAVNGGATALATIDDVAAKTAGVENSTTIAEAGALQFMDPSIKNNDLVCLVATRNSSSTVSSSYLPITVNAAEFGRDVQAPTVTLAVTKSIYSAPEDIMNSYVNISEAVPVQFKVYEEDYLKGFLGLSVSPNWATLDANSVWRTIRDAAPACSISKANAPTGSSVITVESSELNYANYNNRNMIVFHLPVKNNDYASAPTITTFIVDPTSIDTEYANIFITNQLKKPAHASRYDSPNKKLTIRAISTQAATMKTIVLTSATVRSILSLSADTALNTLTQSQYLKVISQNYGVLATKTTTIEAGQEGAITFADSDLTFDSMERDNTALVSLSWTEGAGGKKTASILAQEVVINQASRDPYLFWTATKKNYIMPLADARGNEDQSIAINALDLNYAGAKVKVFDLRGKVVREFLLDQNLAQEDFYYVELLKKNNVPESDVFIVTITKEGQKSIKKVVKMFK